MQQYNGALGEMSQFIGNRIIHVHILMDISPEDTTCEQSATVRG
jgi:hypothetical protein